MRPMSGFESPFRVIISSATSALPATRSARLLPSTLFIHLRSAPAQKLWPAPVSTTARTPASASSRRTAASSSTWSWALMALWISGRLRVSRATPASSISSSMVSKVISGRPPGARQTAPLQLTCRGRRCRRGHSGSALLGTALGSFRSRQRTQGSAPMEHESGRARRTTGGPQGTNPARPESDFN